MFLCSLLDNHPQLYVIPHSIHRIFPTNEDNLPELDEIFMRMKLDESFSGIYQSLEKNYFKNIKFISKQIEPSLENYLIIITLFYHLAENKLKEKISLFSIRTML